MKFEDLQKRRLVEKHQASSDEIKNILQAAEYDIKTAKSLLSTNTYWAFNIAYNSILEAGIALMYTKGYRPTGEAKHVSVILFLREALGKKYEDKLNRFNQMRRRRNKAVYGLLRDLTEYETKDAVKFAEDFLEDIIKLVEVEEQRK